MTNGAGTGGDRRTAPVTRRADLVVLLVLAVCLAVGASLLPVPAHADAGGVTGPGGIGVRLLDAPAATAADPRARLYVVDHLAPGTTIERRVEVTNTTDATATVRLYAAAATIDGDVFTGAAGDSPNELSTWNTVQPGRLDLGAGASAEVTVTIDVPPDAAPGERYAVVWAEVRSGPAGPGDVEQVNRVGIRQYLSVGPGGAPAPDFTIDALTAARSVDGAPVVLATVHNTGGRALDMAGELELLDGPGGLHAGPFAASLGSSLAIGATGEVVVPLDEQVPDGPWEATITLRSGLLERSAEATLTFPPAGATATVPVVPDERWPLLVAGLLLALLCVALVWAVARRRRHAEGFRTSSVPHASREPLGPTVVRDPSGQDDTWRDPTRSTHHDASLQRPTAR